MCNAITHTAERKQKMIGGVLGKREWEDWVEFDKELMLNNLKS